ncbi:MAG: hypothetical protein KDD92_08415 [Caldilineaceae bacterium]|nr:hypothetical protein [Caldilineaceae bacterium]
MPIALSDEFHPDYAALTASAAVQVRSDYGVLLLAGPDRSAFLQRMTTNDIAALVPGQSAVTILTSDTARNRFAFTVVCRDEDFLLLPGPGEAAALAQELQSKIFFMDKVTVANISAPVKRLRLMGPEADGILAQAGVELTDTPDGGWQRAGELTVIKQFAYDVPGYVLLQPAAGVDDLIRRLQTIGAHVLQRNEAYEARRIELGRPRPGAEIVNAYTPLETGMAWVCAENKGCYTGQEIIARQITYDKVTKYLVTLRSAEPLAPGASVTAGDKNAGAITSAAYSPALNAYLALAVLKRAYAEADAVVLVDGVTAQVIPPAEREAAT